MVFYATIFIVPIFAGADEMIYNPLGTAALSELAIEIGIPIAALFIIYSGLMFVTARGNEEKLKKAKTGLMWSLGGTAILLGAWAITEVLKDTIELLE
ncbi:MAG: hypothetical protein UU28_C0042G0010 [Parcubacteria group bacterium GW2011_GWD2_40_9]|nr:MAG: hypothetical protein UU28_C0042G0010 [Parcubacteria group bacterium GW2011_GWD2_40_9]